MARSPKFMLPGQPQHIIQRGNNRETIFGTVPITASIWKSSRRRPTSIADRYRALPLTCMRYIELNPVRAGRVGYPSEYPWSSYRHAALGEADELLNVHDEYRRLGKTDEERQAAYRQRFRDRIAQNTLEKIRQATNKAWVL